MRDKQLKEKYSDLWEDVESSVYEDLLWFLKHKKVSLVTVAEQKKPHIATFKAIVHNAAFTACAHIHAKKRGF